MKLVAKVKHSLSYKRANEICGGAVKRIIISPSSLARSSGKALRLVKGHGIEIELSRRGRPRCMDDELAGRAAMLYTQPEVSIRDIADDLGVSRMSVWRYING